MRIKQWLGVILLLFVVMCGAVSAQEAEPVTVISTPPDTTPPSLAVLILIDDSLTNNRGRGASRLPNVQRDATDPRDYRAQAVADIVQQLHADTVSHRVGVFSFSTTQDRGKWLTNADGNPFIMVGDNADAMPIDALQRVLLEEKRFNGYTVGPGNPAAALDVVTQSFKTLLSSDGVKTYKPVVILLMDDVPIETFPQSPWMSASELWKRDYLPKFENPLRQMVATPYYDGFCKQANDGMTFAVFALGAATWINADGTQNAGQGNYYQELASSLGSSLVYPIDPLQADSAGEQVALDFQPATLNLTHALRCLDPIPIRDGVMTVSQLHRTVHLTVDAPDMSADVRVYDRNGVLLDGRRVESKIGNMRRISMTFAREAVAESDAEWQGEWRIEALDIARLRAGANVDLSGLRAQIETSVSGLTPNRGADFQVALTQHGVIVEDAALIKGVSARLAHNDAQIVLDQQDALYETNVVAFQIANAGNYPLTLFAEIAPIVGLDALPVLALLQADGTEVTLNFSLGVQVQFDQIEPRDIAWCNEKALQEIKIPLAANDDTVSMDSIGSYTRVELYYPTQDPTMAASSATATPFVVLGYQADSTPIFSGMIDCSALQAGAQQVMQVRVLFPGDADLGSNRQIAFTFNPTPTLTPTPTPIATLAHTLTPMPTATPTPMTADHVGAVVETVRTPFASILFFVVAVFAGGLGIQLGIRRYILKFLPLHAVYMKVESEHGVKAPKHLLPRLKRWFPFAQSQTIDLNMHGDADTAQTAKKRLFRVTGNRNKGIDIQAYTDGIAVNNQSVRLNSTVTSTRRETLIEYDGYQITLINWKMR